MSVSLKRLKERYESGEKLNSILKSRVSKELGRVCKFRECEESVAFKSSRASYCCAAHAHKEKYRNKQMNRAKKKAFYKRHKIVFDKTIRNRKITKFLPNTDVLIYTGQHLLYENYKEPLKPIEKTKGFGFYGTVAMTSDKDYLQCHICGNLFSSLGAHLIRHRISGRKYKETYGLALETALVGESQREKLQMRAVDRKIATGEKGLPVWLQKYTKDVQSGKIVHKPGHSPMSLERRNKLGICADQVLEKIRELANKLGHTPSEDEFKEGYNYRYYGAITFQHGSYLNAVAKLGMKSAKELKEHTSEALLENMIEFFERHGRIPMTSDFNRGLLGATRGTYIARFGSLNNARLEAGLNAVIPMPFGQIVELTPEQYAEYKAGHPTEAISEAGHRKRMSRRAKRLARK